MSGIIAWIVLGLVSGAIAKFVHPDNQGSSVWATISLGVLGAILGGYLGKALLGISAGTAVSALTIPSISLALMGAIVLIFFWELLTRRAA